MKILNTLALINPMAVVKGTSLQIKNRLLDLYDGFLLLNPYP